MKIAVISTTILPARPFRLYQGYSGLEKVCGSLGEKFAARGHEVILVGCQGSQADGCKVAELPRGLPEDQALQQYVPQIAGCDIWWDCTWMHYPVIPLLQEPEKYKKSHIMVFHHGVLGDIRTAPPIAHPNWICASNAQSQYISSTLGIPTRFVYHGIDTEVFKPTAGAREDYYLILSRLSPEKGIHESLRILKEKGKSVILIADDQLIADRAYASRIMQEVDGRRVRFISGTNLPLAAQLMWMQSAKAMIHCPLSPWIEIFGLSVAEAGACGLPVLATKNGAMPEIIEHGKTGFLADHPDGLVEFIDRVGEIEPAACRKRIEENFTVDKSADGHLALMADIMAGKEW